MGAANLVEAAPLPPPWSAHHRHDLARPLARLLETGAELLQLDVAADEACEPSRGRGLKPRAGGTNARQLVGLDRVGETFDRERTERLNVDPPFGEAQSVGGDDNGAWHGHLLHPG